MTIPQKQLLLAAFVLVVAAGGWFFFRRTAQPEYAGRGLNYWFREYCRSGQQMTWDASRHEEAEAALCHMGTNAVPYLLEVAFESELAAGGREDLCRLRDAAPRSWGLPTLVAPWIMRGEATEVLREIKPPAIQLLPLLERYLRSTDFKERYRALYILGTTGDGAEQAVPWLCAALRSPDPQECSFAVQSLEWIGTNARTAVPALIKVLQTPETTSQPPWGLARPAARALGAIGSAAAPALPPMQALFERETNWQPRCSIAAALCRIDRGQTNALAFLTNGLATHEPASDRWMAVSELGDIGPNAEAAVPVLRDVVRDGSKPEREAARRALRQIAPTSERAGTWRP